MLRTISAHLELATHGRTNVVFSIAASMGAKLNGEEVRFALDGSPQHPQEIVEENGTRLHQFVTEDGLLTADYSVQVEGRAAPAPVDEAALVGYLRPSRYCESDSLTPTARAEFAGLTGHDVVRAVTQWVSENIAYVPGSSLPTDGATRTLLSRQGVCRDFAHATIALLRAMDVPARMVAVYAPGLSPMDFHAVVEACVDGQWWVVDATRLAPRQSLLRISTGRDAADTAWLTSNWTDLDFVSMHLTVTANELPVDDGVELVQLG